MFVNTDVIATPTAARQCESRERSTAICWDLVDPKLANETYFAAVRDLFD